MSPPPGVYADDMGADGSTLYVDARRYPTRLGALRAANRSPWAEDARWDGWVYQHAGTRDLPMHSHGEDEFSFETDTCTVDGCPVVIPVHVFSVTK